jgi:hypothetical protein
MSGGVRSGDLGGHIPFEMVLSPKNSFRIPLLTWSYDTWRHPSESDCFCREVPRKLPVEATWATARKYREIKAKI